MQISIGGSKESGSGGMKQPIRSVLNILIKIALIISNFDFLLYIIKMMNSLIMKFGGAAVASPDKFGAIADLIVARKKKFERIVVVVSAMGDTTNQLLSLARQVHPSPPTREQDMLVSVGERISMSLLAMALDLKGLEGVSLTGSQAGIITTAEHTEAKIIEVRPHRIVKYLDAGKIVIVAGFQGVSSTGEITTLGRGGSDTTAVALGVALKACRVEFYKDVAGIYAQDPKIHPRAALYTTLSFEEALDLTQKGAKVLHHRSVALASKNGLQLHVLPFAGGSDGTWIGQSEKKAAIYEEES
jgi:aspartate kinase